MPTDLTATVLGGELKLDQPLALPDQSRVRVTIQPVVSNEGWRRALDSLERLRRDRPIHSGGLRFTRDELHDRD
ncbi:MAG: hypothetical protein K8T91_27150 [Planctomycetes bacterium]|nr:hypothetical protein [Planctomycetota bacterium]